MKFIDLVLAATPAILAQGIYVTITRTNGEVALLGPGPGCYGTKGPVSKLSVPENGLAVFYSDYACKGSINFDRMEGDYKLDVPLDAKSVDIIDLDIAQCEA